MCATSGMGAPSMSIVVNELVQAGITTIIRIGTSGSIQDHVRAGEVVIGSGRADEPGRRRSTSPRPSSRPSPTRSSPSPWPTRRPTLGVAHHVGVMASVDTFFEGQERSASSANPHLLRRLRGMIDEYQGLGVLNFEMEAGTLFKMGVVYGFAAGCVCGIIAQRGEAEEPLHDVKDAGDRPGDPGRRRRRRPLERRAADRRSLHGRRPARPRRLRRRTVDGRRRSRLVGAGRGRWTGRARRPLTTPSTASSRRRCSWRRAAPTATRTCRSSGPAPTPRSPSSSSRSP